MNKKISLSLSLPFPPRAIDGFNNIVFWSQCATEAVNNLLQRFLASCCTKLSVRWINNALAWELTHSYYNSSKSCQELMPMNSDGPFCGRFYFYLCSVLVRFDYIMHHVSLPRNSSTCLALLLCYYYYCTYVSIFRYWFASLFIITINLITALSLSALSQPKCKYVYHDMYLFDSSVW